VILLGGRRVEVPGFPDAKNPLDHAGIPWATDGAARPHVPLAVVLHTTKGRTGALVDTAAAPSERAERYARYQAGTASDKSWDFTVDLDATIVQSNDPTGACGGRATPIYTWHCGAANVWTVGIEIVQAEDRRLYARQLAAAVALATVLCDTYGITKRVPCDAQGAPWEGPINEVVSHKRGGRQGRLSGVFNHCNLTTPDSRGPGDAGPHVRAACLAGGFAPFDVTDLARR